MGLGHRGAVGILSLAPDSIWILYFDQNPKGVESGVRILCFGADDWDPKELRDVMTRPLNKTS